MATAIVRKRFWRRTWFIVLSSLAGISTTVLVTLAVAVYHITLMDVPDIREPFDLEEFGHVDVAPEENAFELYRAAAAKLAPETVALRQQCNDALDAGSIQISEELRDLLEKNRGALELFWQASERPEAVYVQQAEMTFVTQLTLLNSLADLNRLALLDALRLEATGEPVVAWDWYAAVLRSSRHAGRHGGMVERDIGIAIHSRIGPAILQWSANPKLTSEDFRRALADVRAIYARTVPPSQGLRSEYLITRQYYANIDLFSRDLEFPWYVANHCVLFPMGEPEMGRRLTKMIWTNWLSQCDRPRHLRTPVAAGTAGLFSPGPNAGVIELGLPNAKIEDCLNRSILAKYFLLAPRQSIISHDCEVARQYIVETALAMQTHFHELGSYPEHLEQLVGFGLEKVPVDPFGNGEPLRFRCESNAADGVTIWSIGPDAIDNDGRVKLQKRSETGLTREGDVIGRIFPPRKREATE